MGYGARMPLPVRESSTTTSPTYGEKSRTIRPTRDTCATCAAWVTGSMVEMARIRNTVLLALCVALLPAQEDSDRQLEAAIYREVVVGDLKGAIDKYRAILARPEAPRPIAARALSHMGDC